MQTKANTIKKLTASLVLVILLSMCLAISTIALALSMVSIENNFFIAGTVKINLNDSKPIIEEHEFLFEPGMTVRKEFFVKNESNCDVYYKLYFQNVAGGLSDILEVKICDNDNVLFGGTAKELSKENVPVPDDVLKAGEIRKLQIYFYFPKEADNEAQNLYLTFDMGADAVQTKNNINKEFGS